MTTPLQQFTDTMRQVDMTVAAAERKWGIGRLRLLVSGEMRAKFDGAHERWLATVKAAQDSRLSPLALADLAKWGGVMSRAWAAMDAEAFQRGAEALSIDAWEVERDEPGLPVLALCKTPLEAHAYAARAQAEGRLVEVWTLAEFARVAAARSILSEIKTAFPGCQVMPSYRPKDRNFRLDEIPDFCNFSHEEDAA